MHTNCLVLLLSSRCWHDGACSDSAAGSVQCKQCWASAMAGPAEVQRSQQHRTAPPRLPKLYSCATDDTAAFDHQRCWAAAVVSSLLLLLLLFGCDHRRFFTAAAVGDQCLCLQAAAVPLLLWMAVVATTPPAASASLSLVFVPGRV